MNIPPHTPHPTHTPCSTRVSRILCHIQPIILQEQQAECRQESREGRQKNHNKPQTCHSCSRPFRVQSFTLSSTPLSLFQVSSHEMSVLYLRKMPAFHEAPSILRALVTAPVLWSTGLNPIRTGIWEQSGEERREHDFSSVPSWSLRSYRPLKTQR